MNNHESLDSMLAYIHESIKRDCEHHIMMNRVSLGLPPTDEKVRIDVPSIEFKASIIDEDKIKGFKGDSIFDWTKNFIFPTVRHGKSWFWLKMLMRERYYAEQKRIMLTDMSNHTKPNLDGVIWWNYPLFSYAVGKMKEYKIGEYVALNTDWDLVSTLYRLYYLDQGEDVTIWGETLRHFGRNYTEGLKISRWNSSYIKKEMYPGLSDDEIEYMNHMWNALFSDRPYTPDFNNNKPKNKWLERKTKRGK